MEGVVNRDLNFMEHNAGIGASPWSTPISSPHVHNHLEMPLAVIKVSVGLTATSSPSEINLVIVKKSFMQVETTIISQQSIKVVKPNEWKLKSYLLVYSEMKGWHNSLITASSDYQKSSNWQSISTSNTAGSKEFAVVHKFHISSNYMPLPSQCNVATSTC